jgi:hypothetical protein
MARQREGRPALDRRSASGHHRVMSWSLEGVGAVRAEEVDHVRRIVRGLGDRDLVVASVCEGCWVADLVVHLRLGAEAILIGLSSPTDDDPGTSSRTGGTGHHEALLRSRTCDPPGQWPPRIPRVRVCAGTLRTSQQVRAERRGLLDPAASAFKATCSRCGTCWRCGTSNSRCTTWTSSRISAIAAFPVARHWRSPPQPSRG